MNDKRPSSSSSYLTSTPKKEVSDGSDYKVKTLLDDPLISSIDESDDQEQEVTEDESNELPSSFSKSFQDIQSTLTSTIMNDKSICSHKYENTIEDIPIDTRLKERVRQRLFSLANTLEKENVSHSLEMSPEKGVVPLSQSLVLPNQQTSLILNRSSSALSHLLEAQMKNFIISNNELNKKQIDIAVKSKDVEMKKTIESIQKNVDETIKNVTEDLTLRYENEVECLKIENDMLKQKMEKLHEKLLSSEEINLELQKYISQIVLERNNLSEKVSILNNKLETNETCTEVLNNYKQKCKQLAEEKEIHSKSYESRLQEISAKYDALNVKLLEASNQNMRFQEKIKEEQRKLATAETLLEEKRNELEQQKENLDLNEISKKFKDLKTHDISLCHQRNEESELKTQLKLCSKLLVQKDLAIKNMIDSYESQISDMKKHNKMQISEYKKAIRMLKAGTFHPT